MKESWTVRRDRKAIGAAAGAPTPAFTSAMEIEANLARAVVDTYLAHLAEHGDDAGRQWKLVPVEPTEKMQREGADFLPVTPGGATNACAGRVWEAMIFDAPSIAGEEDTQSRCPDCGALVSDDGSNIDPERACFHCRMD